MIASETLMRSNGGDDGGNFARFCWGGYSSFASTLVDLQCLPHVVSESKSKNQISIPRGWDCDSIENERKHVEDRYKSMNENGHEGGMRNLQDDEYA